MSNVKGRVRKIKHNLFLECAELEPHQFWKVEFTKYAYGKFPRGVTYSGNQLIVKRGRRRKQQIYQISATPELARISMKKILRETTGLIASTELIKKKIRVRKLLDSITFPENCQWNDIKAPTAHALMISIYVDMAKGKYELSESEADNLFIVICSGLTLGSIKPGDIHLNRGEIVRIDGISRASNGFFTTREPAPLDRPSKKPTKSSQKNFGSDYVKYNQVRKNRVRSAGL